MYKTNCLIQSSYLSAGHSVALTSIVILVLGLSKELSLIFGTTTYIQNNLWFKYFGTVNLVWALPQ